MVTCVLVLLMCVIWGCGDGGLSPEDEFLGQAMALTNVGKVEVRNSAGEITGLQVSVDVVNTAPVAIDSPFVMTWWLRLPNGDVLAKATRRFSGRSFGIGERQRVQIVLEFPARMDLTGVQDAVTFAFDTTLSSAAMEDAEVLVMSSGGPCKTWMYRRDG